MSGLTPKYLNVVKKEIISWSRRLSAQGLLTGYEGNLSVRLGKEMMLITRNRCDKQWLQEEDIVLSSFEGEPLAGFQEAGLLVSSEYRLHTEVYRQSPESRAVVHAHPMHAILMSLHQLTFTPALLPEALLYFGKEIPTASFAMPGTDDVSESIRQFLPQNKAIVLSNHGAVTHAEDLSQAGNFMEMLEKLARIHLLAAQNQKIGFPLPGLSEDKIRKILG